MHKIFTGEIFVFQNIGTRIRIRHEIIDMFYHYLWNGKGTESRDEL